MKITCIEYPTDQDWIACKERALVTVGLKVKNPPTDEWKKSILKARHSPIRRLRFSFLLEDIPSWVSVHLVRHIHAQPYVRSQRNDRQSNYDRTKAPQDAPVDMIWDMNAEELMVVANKRLCNQASEKTREVVRLMCNEVLKTNPEFKDFLVPMCAYVGECKEMYPCGGRKDE
jgi:thymidylate synthase ThyX